MRAITIRQPWAWAVIHAGKTVENRSRNIAGDYRGLVAIHAGLTIDAAGQHDPLVLESWTGETRLARDPGNPTVYRDVPWRKAFSYGRIIGVVDLVDVHICNALTGCKTGREPHDNMRKAICSPWGHDGMTHLVFANPRPVAYAVPVRGRLGLWTLPDDVEQAVRRQL